MEQNMTPHGSLFTQRLSGEHFDLIRSKVYVYAGINIAQTKKQMVEGRLRARVRSLGLGSFTEYCDYVFLNDSSQKEFIHLVDAITTNKTEFFREPKHYDFVRKSLLPKLVSQGKVSKRRPMLVWSAACSTGQEPYSFAMELAEFERHNPDFAYQILATDISTQVLDIARRAVYNKEAASQIQSELQKRYLLKSKDHRSGLVRIVPELRKHVLFRRFNLNEQDYGLSDKMDLILCRNVIIYFDNRTQEAILKRLIYCLKKGGLLFLGHSESIHGMDLPVRQIAPTIYERK